MFLYGIRKCQEFKGHKTISGIIHQYHIFKIYTRLQSWLKVEVPKIPRDLIRIWYCNCSHFLWRPPSLVLLGMWSSSLLIWTLFASPDLNKWKTVICKKKNRLTKTKELSILNILNRNYLVHHQRNQGHCKWWWQERRPPGPGRRLSRISSLSSILAAS